MNIEKSNDKSKWYNGNAVTTSDLEYLSKSNWQKSYFK